MTPTEALARLRARDDERVVGWTDTQRLTALLTDIDAAIAQAAEAADREAAETVVADPSAAADPLYLDRAQQGWVERTTIAAQRAADLPKPSDLRGIGSAEWAAGFHHAAAADLDVEALALPDEATREEWDRWKPTIAAAYRQGLRQGARLLADRVKSAAAKEARRG